MRADGNMWVHIGLATILLVNFIPGFKGAPTWEVEEQHTSLIDPLIVNGTNIDIKQAPYQISLEFFRYSICGGVIVSHFWALTAAHCIHPRLAGSIWSKRIRAGATRQIPFVGWEGTIHQIEYSCFNPKFTLEKLDYDVAVLKVAKRFEFSDRIRPIALSSTPEDSFIDYKQTAVTSGWGLTKGENWFGSWDLKSVTVPLVSREDCISRYKGVKSNSTTFNPVITTRMLCAAGNGKGSACGGDSGGPLVQKGHVIGLTSWGARCNDPKLPIVYTNLLNPEIKAFIQSHGAI